MYNLICQATDESFPFQPVIDDLKVHTADVEYIADLMAFINAFILCEDHHDGRIQQRDMFIKAGLLEILESEEFKRDLS